MKLSHVFAGQNVGVTQVGERLWLVTFMQDDLEYFDDETCRREPIEHPFGPKVLPMRSRINCSRVSGMDLSVLARPAGLEPATSWFVAQCRCLDSGVLRVCSPDVNLLLPDVREEIVP